MAKDSIIGIVNRLITRRLNSLALTDIVVGEITSLEPITITIMKGSDAIPIPAELIDLDALPEDIQLGDRYRFIRYNNGSRFLAIGKKIPNKEG